MDDRHGEPSSPKLAGGNEVEENLESSDAAWIRKFQDDIRKLSAWMPPWEIRKRKQQMARPSIFRVPASLREQSDKKAPQDVVGIGLFNRSGFRMDDIFKRGCVSYFVSQHSLDVQKWLLDMKPREREARLYYSYEWYNSDALYYQDSHRFLQMLLLDGCFILIALEAMRSLTYDLQWPSEKIMLDLLKVENQIPFFVLVQLYDGIGGEAAFGKFAPKFTGTFIHYALCCLDHQTRMIGNRNPPIRPVDVRHLLHLFRLSLEPAAVPRIPTIKISRFPTATELQDRDAVKFERRHSGSFSKQKRHRGSSILDITFHKGVMKIPLFEINDGVETILRNLIAFEQGYFPDIEPVVTSYVEFMDILIGGESDANLLESSGILLNSLPTRRDAAFFFSKLNPRDGFRSAYLHGVIDNINTYRASKWNRRWNRWSADLKLNYFSNPWVTLSVVAAVVLLILSFIQAYYSVLGYYRR